MHGILNHGKSVIKLVFASICSEVSKHSDLKKKLAEDIKEKANIVGGGFDSLSNKNSINMIIFKKVVNL